VTAMIIKSGTMIGAIYFHKRIGDRPPAVTARSIIARLRCPRPNLIAKDYCIFAIVVAKVLRDWKIKLAAGIRDEQTFLS